jgi:Double-GTPase 2
MTADCSFEGCTVAETGRCALENDPANCSNRVGTATALDTSMTVEVSTASTNTIGAPVLTQPDELPSFPASTTLGIEVIEEMMAARYVTLVGILGDPDSGKTACLASLYLLVSNALLEGYSFADSLSLMAFEDIARGARRWNEGQLPEQMTTHTEVADDRRPGFLHLRLRRESDGRCIDMALPDLPGEWTKALVRSSRSDRLEFLRSTDVIWLVVDGRILASREQRQGCITRLGQLAGRLRTLIDDAMPSLILVVTHCDEVEISSDVFSRVATELTKHNLSAEVVQVAPFSENEKVKAGFGLAALVSATVGRNSPTPEFWPVSQPGLGERSFLSFRRAR